MFPRRASQFTLTTPGCLDRVADFRAKLDGKVMVGCGTVMDIPDAKAAMDAGSEFLVAPVLVPEVHAVSFPSSLHRPKSPMRVPRRASPPEVACSTAFTAAACD